MVSRAVGGPPRRVHCAVRLNDEFPAFGFSHSGSQKTDQLLEGLELLRGRLMMIVVSHEADTDSDAVHVIAVNMSSRNLALPTISHFDLSIAR